MKNEENILKNDWEKERNIQKEIKETKEKLEEAKFKLEVAENNYDLESSAVLRHGTIPELENKNRHSNLVSMKYKKKLKRPKLKMNMKD